MHRRSVLVTGAAGYLGRQLIQALVARGEGGVVAVDVRDIPQDKKYLGVDYHVADIRYREFVELLRIKKPRVVVHLAAIVTPPKGSTPEYEYTVDVTGTSNVLNTCRAVGVEKIVVTSSGAAYGYHPDNPPFISEDWPIRGNENFTYARHKRLVEHMLARWRIDHPELKQVVFRIGTILGETVRNQITASFLRPRLLTIKGTSSPFVFIWDKDVVGCLLRAIDTDKTGIYNVAGDGIVTVPEIASRLGKEYDEWPAWLLKAKLYLNQQLGRAKYGPEQVDFLRYRPVLDNRRLKEEFGYTPRKTSSEVFDLWLRSQSVKEAR